MRLLQMTKYIFTGQNNSINAVPKIRFKDEKEVFNTNSKRSTLDMANFQRIKLNTTIRDKFESNGSEPIEIKKILQPKKKIVDLGQILLKVPFYFWSDIFLNLNCDCSRPKLMN